MTRIRAFAAAGLALAAALGLGGGAGAQDGARPKPVAPADKGAESDVARFCANVAPSAAEARIAWQTKRLNELDAQIKQRVGELEKQEAQAREWVTKREAMMKAANDNVVAIYAKMDAEAAAAELASLDDPVAAAILARLSPRAAGTILAQMEAGKAARLTGLMSGAPTEEKKS